MIKKILCAFLVCLISINSYANIHIDPKLVLTVVKIHIPDENVRAKVLKVYKAELNKNTPKNSLSAASISKMCDAAGWDRTKDSKKRGNFRKDLIIRSYYTYYEVCKTKGISGGTEICDDKIFDDINVTMQEADALAKEYILLKYKDEVQCSTKTRPGTYNKLNDYVKCTSKFYPQYYEFKFDDVVESNQKHVENNVEKAICKFYGVGYERQVLNSEFRLNMDESGHLAYCKTHDAALCQKINKTAQRLNRIAEIGFADHANWCVLKPKQATTTTKTNTVHGFKTIDGIDPLDFYVGRVTIQPNRNLDAQIKEYVQKKIKTVNSFRCEKTTYRVNQKDYSKDATVKTCYVNGSPVEFVFKDLSAATSIDDKSGQQIMGCMARGGKYAGNDCFDLSKAQCDEVAKQVGGGGTEYEDGVCILKATKAKDKKEKIEFALTSGIAIADCAVGTRTGCVMIGVQITAGATKYAIKEEALERLKNFMKVATQCNGRSCAINTIKKSAEVLSTASILEKEDAIIVDQELARLVSYIEPGDLKYAGDWGEVIKSLGGDPNDTSGKALHALYLVCTGVQYAGAVVSSLSLTKKALETLATRLDKGASLATISEDMKLAKDTYGKIKSTYSKTTALPGQVGEATGLVKDATTSISSTSNLASGFAAAAAAAADVVK